MKKIFKILLIGILCFIGMLDVKGATYSGKVYEQYWQSSGVNVFAEDTTYNSMDYNGWMIKSTIDNKIYYCIEPELSLEGTYNGTHETITGDNNIINSSRLTASTYRKIRLLAYYGYGYKDENYNHTSKKWYGITQVMIWQTLRTDIKWVFKDSRYGNTNSSLYVNEVKELNNLVNNHTKTPSFNDETIEINLGETIELEDANNVLNLFNVTSNVEGLEITKKDNKLILKANEIVEGTISLSKNYGVGNFVLLNSNSFQDVIGRGDPQMIKSTLNFKVTGGILNLTKNDETTNKNVPLGDATLEGAVYEIYDEDNNIVETITTDANGTATTNLKLGKYTLKEINAPKGYNINNQVYEIEITSENPVIDLVTTDKVIVGKTLLTKVKGGAGEPFIAESGAEFDIIDSKGNVVEKLITNENGISIVSLPYGKYIIHQTKGSENYIFSDDVTINIVEDKIYEIELKNLKLSKLEFTKTDFASGESLPNTSMEFYKEDGTLIYSGKTDENGKIEIPNLKIGKYYFIEKEAPKYYRLNNEKVYFEIKENGSIVKTSMTNEKNEGILEFTKTDFSTSEALPNTKIEIYYTETNELVFRDYTDENGKIIIEELVAGNYCIYETEAPKGYKLNEEPMCFEIKEDGEVIKINMTNEKNEKIKNPETSDNIQKYCFYLGISSIALLVLLILIIKNKKIKK